MVPWIFELDSADGLADFIEYHSCLLPETDRHLGQISFNRSEVLFKGKEVLHVQALTVGRVTWGVRQALAEWVRGDGRLEEREAILQVARPTTAVLLARLFKAQPKACLEENMATEQAVFALHDEERTELAYLRPELWLTLWRQASPVIRKSGYAFEREAAFFESRLREERKHLKEDVGALAQKRIKSLKELEERVFLRGERVDVSMWE